MLSHVEPIAKGLILTGLGLTLLGVILWKLPQALSWFGRLPGDIRMEGERGSFHFPIVTCILLSLALSGLLALIRRLSGS